MHVMARALWAPKAGNRSDEYEDAFWPQRTINRTVNRSGLFRLAVADGATETSFAGLWARRLVRAYGSGCFAGQQLAGAAAAGAGGMVCRGAAESAAVVCRGEGAQRCLCGPVGA